MHADGWVNKPCELDERLSGQDGQYTWRIRSIYIIYIYIYIYIYKPEHVGNATITTSAMSWDLLSRRRLSLNRMLQS